MTKGTRNLLISTYVCGIDEAIKTCKSALEEIHQDLNQPYITVATSENIEKLLSYVKRLQELIEEGFRNLDNLMNEETAA